LNDADMHFSSVERDREGLLLNAALA